MKINIQTLSEGIYEVSERISAEDLGIKVPYKFSDKVEIKAFVDKFEDSYRVKLKVDADVIQDCDRCLEEFQSEFKEAIEQIYHIGASEFEDDDIEVLPHNTREIDLKPLINEVFLINRPIQKVCRENCLGLCPACGKNLNHEKCNCKQDNIDPRLEKLRSLIK